LREAAGYQQATRARPLREPYLAVARSRVDGAAWSIAGENGRSITFEDSVAYALERALTPDPQAVLLLLLDLLKFVVPEQLGAALIQEHV